MNDFELIAKTFMGLEPVLAKELTQIGANNVQIGRRMVSFTGDKEIMYRANFQLHTAIRILKPIARFKASSADDVYEEIKKIETELKRVQKANPSEYKSLDLELRRLRCGRDDKFKRSLIDFWTRNNVLPKYGFPVDTVELQIAGKKSGTSNEDLTLARDLQMAIAEYAPGSGVIADGKLYTSRYIRMESKAKKAASRGYYAKCHKCDQFNFTDDALVRRRGKECISCGEKIPSMRWRPTLEPRLGFITDKADAQDAPLRRPERDYKTDDHYVGDSQHDVIKKMCFSFDGAEVELQSTANDSLVVVGSDSHRVCPYCGWTSNANEALKPQHNTSPMCLKPMLSKSPSLQQNQPNLKKSFQRCMRCWKAFPENWVLSGPI